MNRKRVIVVLLCVLGFLAAAGLKRAFGTGEGVRPSVPVQQIKSIP